MRDPEPQPASFSPARRLGIGLNVVLSVAALLALVLMVNYLGARHYRRFQWTSDPRYQLTTQTRSVLGAITNEIRVTILFDRREALFGPVSGLLKEYAYACPKLVVEHVDYKRDVDRAQLLITRYQLPQTEADLVIFEAQGRTRAVRASELSDYDWSGALAPRREIRRVAFRGEALFTAALGSLLEASSPVAYFLRGHGEHDPAGTAVADGYSTFAGLLRQKNITVKPVTLTGGIEVPADCQLLIIAGPKDRLDADELNRIGRYLGQGGRLLALLSYFRAGNGPTGLERLLAGWGVTVGENYVFDPKNSQSNNDVVATNLSAHPIVKPLQGSGLRLLLPRSVGSAQTGPASPDAARVQPLAFTGEEGYTASEVQPNGAVRINPLVDRRGALPLAVAIEKGSLQGVSADRGSTRIVVAGDSLFLGNGVIEDRANLEFGSLAVNWLLDRPQHLAGIPARPIKEYRFLLTHAEMLALRWLLLAALPGTVLLAGSLVWVRRRR